jgi:hypothetical protein
LGERRSSFDLNLPSCKSALAAIVRKREPKRKRRGNRGLSTNRAVIVGLILVFGS